MKYTDGPLQPKSNSGASHGRSEVSTVQVPSDLFFHWHLVFQ